MSYCGPGESFLQSTIKSGIGDEEESNARSLVRSLVSQYEVAKAWVRVLVGYLRSFRLKWGWTKDPCCHWIGKRMLCELLYRDNLVLIRETIEVHRNMLRKWKESSKSRGLKVNLEKTKVMARVDIPKDGLFNSKVCPCWMCDLKVNVLSVHCGKWIHIRYSEVKKVVPMFLWSVSYRTYDGSIGGAIEQDEKPCNEVVAVWKFAYICDSVNAGIGCKAALTDGMKCGWFLFGEYKVLLYGKRFPLNPKGSVYKSYTRPAFLKYGAW